jgi:hypothetical protein
LEGTDNRPTPCSIDPVDILETADAAFVGLGRDLTIEYANARALAFLGVRLDACVGRPLFTVFPELARSNLPRVLQSVSADGVSRTVETSERSHGPRVALAIHWTISGILIWFREIGDVPLNPVESTDRHEALDLAETSSGIGVWDVDLRTQTVRGTQQFFRIMGLPPATKAVPMETMRQLRYPEDQKRLADDYEKARGSQFDRRAVPL